GRDDRSDAGCERLLLLPQVSGEGRPDPDASLGSGDDVSGARPAAAAARGAGREHSVNTVRTDGHLIVNADDWGRDQPTTDCTFDCVKKGAVSAVSAMVFMEDSERAAAIAREHSVDAGLHLNFTSPFTSSQCPPRLDQQQRRITSYLKAHRMAQLVFNPMLTRAFDDVVRAQVDEFRRLYGTNPARIDGHHHMHLCANVVLQGLLPTGTVVRRNFSFRTGEKGIVNRTPSAARPRARAAPSDGRSSVLHRA